MALALGSTAAFAGDRTMKCRIPAIDPEVLRRALGVPGPWVVDHAGARPREWRVSWQESQDGVTWWSGKLYGDTQPGAIEGWRAVVRHNEKFGIEMRDSTLEMA